MPKSKNSQCNDECLIGITPGHNISPSKQDDPPRCSSLVISRGSSDSGSTNFFLNPRPELPVRKAGLEAESG
jgi:hypothetical protein